MAEREFKTILVTGGAGFIGSNFIHYMVKKYSEYNIINLDKLTYAGNLENLKSIENKPNYKFIKGDIAAESHVDRSIDDPGVFIQTDVYGTFVLFEAAKNHKTKLFFHISTDEVYGSILNGSFKETDPLLPNSPYSASKAGAEMLAVSYTHLTLPTILRV